MDTAAIITEIKRRAAAHAKAAETSGQKSRDKLRARESEMTDLLTWIAQHGS